MPAGTLLPGSGYRATSSAVRRSAKLRAEEVEDTTPRLRGSTRVVDLGAGVVEEGVVGARVDEQLVLHAGGVERLLQAGDRFGVEVVVLLGVVALHLGRHLRVVGLRALPRDQSVERCDRLHLVAPLGAD